MEITKEQLDQLIDQKVNEKVESMVNKPKRPLEWAKLSQEIQEYTKRKYDHGHQTESYKVIGAINTILRFHLGIKNVYQISELNIDEARKAFEVLKTII